MIILEIEKYLAVSNASGIVLSASYSSHILFLVVLWGGLLLFLFLHMRTLSLKEFSKLP